MTTQEVTILLVEDDDVDVDVDAMEIKRAFKRQRIGSHVVRACDGLQALEILKYEGVDTPIIILLDLQMPRMNGLEFLEAIRQNPKYASSIVVVLTTSKADEDLVSSYKHNIAGYFLKDSAGDEFLDIVNLLDCYSKVAHFPSI